MNARGPVRVSVALLSLAVCLIARGGHAAEPDPVATVTGFLDDVRAGKPLGDLVRWWDGEALARRIFHAEWPDLDADERAEIVGIVSEFAPRAFARGTLHEGVQDEGPPILAYDAPRRVEDEAGLACVVADLRVGQGPEQAKSVRLLLASTPAGMRLVDWGKVGKPTFGVGFAGLRRAAAAAEGPLLFAWTHLAALYAGKPQEPPATSALFAPQRADVPEWLTRDLPGLDLPVLSFAEPDRRRPAATNARWGPSVVVNLRADGRMSFRRQGRRSPLVSSEGPRVGAGHSREAIEALRVALLEAVPEGASPPVLIVRAEQDARWDLAHAVARLATSSEVGITEVAFACLPDEQGVSRVVWFSTGSFLSERPGKAAGGASNDVEAVLTREGRKRPANPQEPDLTETLVTMAGTVEARLALPQRGGPQREMLELARTTALGRVREATKKAATSTSGREVGGVVVAASPHVPTGDVLAVVGAMRAAVGTDVQIVTPDSGSR
jgi:hypothetical protein